MKWTTGGNAARNGHGALARDLDEAARARARTSARSSGSRRRVASTGRSKPNSLGRGSRHPLEEEDQGIQPIGPSDTPLVRAPDVDTTRVQSINQAVNAGLIAVVACLALMTFFSTPSFQEAWRELSASPAFAKMCAAVRALPISNWEALEAAIQLHPWRMASIVTGVAYAAADWTAQTAEGAGIFQFDRARLAQCVFIGAALLAPMAHAYYGWQDTLIHASVALWISVPAKIVVDQVLYAPFYNMLFFIFTGVLRRDTPREIFGDLMPKLWRTTLSSWKVWPFVHLITYTVIPTRYKLMWVDTMEVLWITYLSLVANEAKKKETNATAAAAREQEAAAAVAAQVVSGENTEPAMEDAWKVVGV